MRDVLRLFTAHGSRADTFQFQSFELQLFAATVRSRKVYSGASTKLQKFCFCWMSEHGTGIQHKANHVKEDVVHRNKLNLLVNF